MMDLKKLQLWAFNGVNYCTEVLRCEGCDEFCYGVFVLEKNVLKSKGVVGSVFCLDCDVKFARKDVDFVKRFGGLMVRTVTEEDRCIVQVMLGVPDGAVLVDHSFQGTDYARVHGELVGVGELDKIERGRVVDRTKLAGKESFEGLLVGKKVDLIENKGG